MIVNLDKFHAIFLFYQTESDMSRNRKIDQNSIKSTNTIRLLGVNNENINRGLTFTFQNCALKEQYSQMLDDDSGIIWAKIKKRGHNQQLYFLKL